MELWTRSRLFFVPDIASAIDFNIDRHGFTLNMRHVKERREAVAEPDKTATGRPYDQDGVALLEKRLMD